METMKIIMVLIAMYNKQRIIEQINIDALSYLALANQYLHILNPPAFSIAEDVSGYPLLASPLIKGGIGFDYRMNMAIAGRQIECSIIRQMDSTIQRK